MNDKIPTTQELEEWWRLGDGHQKRLVQEVWRLRSKVLELETAILEESNTPEPVPGPWS